jgi:phenylpropionate dioxygenase-like ring-hydroxylating dioxygenase large terminal subunit
LPIGLRQRNILVIMTVDLPLADAIPPDIRARMNAARVSPEAFAEERAALGYCWTFLGFDHQVARPNDWFRTTLGGRSILVQRFEQGLAAFENKCAHRGYPLRTEDAGNGPLVCGFHHWRYNHEGVALGIPNCPDMFGKPPREIDARLERVEIAQAGSMLFGRFADPSGPSLADWLGPALPILNHVSGFMRREAGRFERTVKANWRFMMEISLDDYHLVAVHPTTFGKAGYIPGNGTHYERFGMHSAYFRGGNAESLPDMVRLCEEGTYFPDRYRIFQLFPGLIISFVHTQRYLGDGYWYLLVQHLRPEAHDRTRSVSYFFPVQHPATEQAWRKIARTLAWPTFNAIFRFFARRVHMEDNVACENLQKIAGFDDPPPRLALHEQRIGWFEEAYAEAISRAEPGR